MPLKSLKLQDGPDVSLLSLSFMSKSPIKDMGQKRRKKKIIKKRNSLPSQCNKTHIRQSSASTVSTTHNSSKSPDGSKTKLPGIAAEKDKDGGCKQRVFTTPSPRLYFIPSVLPLGERRKKIPLLAAIKPDNDKSEKDRFMRANYNYNPYFIYRCPAESEVLESFSKPSDKYLKQVGSLLFTIWRWKYKLVITDAYDVTIIRYEKVWRAVAKMFAILYVIWHYKFCEWWIYL